MPARAAPRNRCTARRRPVARRVSLDHIDRDTVRRAAVDRHTESDREAADALERSAVPRFPVLVYESDRRDRKSTRLNSSHLVISYAVFCLKKKKKSTTDSTLHETD